MSVVIALLDQKTENHTPYLPQCEVQVRGVVAGRRINHCVAAQRQIRAICPHPYPIMRILF